MPCRLARGSSGVPHHHLDCIANPSPLASLNKYTLPLYPSRELATRTETQVIDVRVGLEVLQRPSQGTSGSSIGGAACAGCKKATQHNGMTAVARRCNRRSNIRDVTSSHLTTIASHRSCTLYAMGGAINHMQMSNASTSILLYTSVAHVSWYKDLGYQAYRKSLG